MFLRANENFVGLQYAEYQLPQNVRILILRTGEYILLNGMGEIKS